MSAIITEKFRLHNASQFVESFTEASASTYYLFLGKATAFSSTTTGEIVLEDGTQDNVGESFKLVLDTTADENDNIDLEGATGIIP